MLTFQKESFRALLPELPEIWRRHYKEVALDQEVIKLSPDFDQYALMDLHGMLHIMTVRADGVLVGYYFAIVRQHLHFKDSKTAYSDIFIILPEYRAGWTGYKLFREAEKMLKALGVQKSYVMTKVHLPITIIMKRLGYRFIERIYTKLL